jgi:hypothetical protein
MSPYLVIYRPWLIFCSSQNRDEICRYYRWLNDCLVPTLEPSPLIHITPEWHYDEAMPFML